MTKEYFLQLLKGYKKQSLTPEELRLFLHAVKEPEYEGMLGQEFIKDLESGRYTGLSAVEREDKVWNALEAATLQTPRIGVTKRWAWLAAAAAAAVLAVGIWWMNKKPAGKQASPGLAIQQPKDLVPGKQGAILTLANGRQIVLDSVVNGTVALEGNAAIVKKKEGISYQADTRPVDAEAMFNTIATPKGRQYTVTLPDGSRVWLNAASSIRFPVAFTGNKRNVTITGEVYFEIAQDARKPFIVLAGETAVEVLGTHFNINSYADEEAVRTTLLEGKVRVTANDKAAVLQPGEQAECRSTGGVRIIKDIDIEKTMAWKEGKFIFERDALPEIMRQIGRWYDVEVVYEGNPPAMHFSGIINRNRNASEVLAMLAATENVHFTIEGQKIIVHP